MAGAAGATTAPWTGIHRGEPMMTDLDKGFPGGGEPPRQEGGSMPFFPAPPAGPPPSTGGPARPVMPSPPPGVPGPREPNEPRPPAHAAGNEPSAQAAAPSGGPAAVVKGRITIEDQVIEKIAVLAALEVSGVAGSVARASGAAAPADARPEVRVHLHDDEASVDLGVAVEYGCVVMDVAKEVKANVARAVGRMLGMRVAAVNVSVEDVRSPASR